MDIPYENTVFSPVKNLSNVGENETSDPYHFGFSLIEMIQETPNQEVGTHTFTHYYCLENGQNKEHFEKDLEAVSSLGKTAHPELASITHNSSPNDRSLLIKYFEKP